MKDAINEEGKWKTLKSEYLHERPWLTVRRDCVQRANPIIAPARKIRRAGRQEKSR